MSAPVSEAVERPSIDGPIWTNAEVGAMGAAFTRVIEDLRARLASLEEEKVKDGEALKPFAEAADDLDDDHADGSNIWEAPAAMNIDARHLRAARARLSHEQDQ